MKHSLYKSCLKLSRKLAKLIQIGNPAGRAPSLVHEPKNKEKFKSFGWGMNDTAVWKFKQVVCSGLYGGAVITAQNQVHSRFLTYPWGKKLHPALSAPYLGKKTGSIEKAVFLITVACKCNYYHWIADLLPRLLLAQKSGMADLPERHYILHQPSRSYEEDTLALLGIDPHKVVRLHDFETLAVNDLLMPDFLHSRDGQAFPPWKKALLDEFKEKVLGPSQKPPHRKLYLLRGKQKTRRLLGEERLVEVLQQQGFEIIDPQQLGLLEQMHTLAEAQTVVGLHGAALTNIIFCQPNTLVLELRSTFKAPEYYSAIAKTYGFQFETICLPPKKIVQPRHLANEQHLLLTEAHIQQLLGKISVAVPPEALLHN